MNSDRVDELIEKLGLKAHPEGGFYSEVYRSREKVVTDAGERNLCTSIFFLLRSADISHFHRIQSDELWFWHEGAPLSVHLLGEKGHQILKLGPADQQGTLPQHLVKAHSIFGSTVDHPESFSLVSCVVAPGFDFRDFELFEREELLAKFPSSVEIIRKLT